MPTLYDPRGNPIDSSSLLREHVDDEDWLSSPTQWDEVASSLTPTRLAQLLRDADAGDVQSYLTLAYEIERRDLHYRGAIGQRKMVISQLVPEVVPASDSAEDKAIAEDVRKLVTGRSFRRLLFHMMDAVAKGYALVEIIWDTSAGEWRPIDYQWRDQRLYRVDPFSLRAYRLEDGSAKGAELPAHKYVIHEAMLASGPALQNGMVRPVMAAYLCKSYTVRDLMRFLEVYGIPMRLGKYPKNATREYRQRMLTALARMGSHAYGSIPDDMSVELMESMKGGESKAFLGAAEFWDRQQSKAILGQTSSIDGKAGGSYKSDSHHKGVRLDIAAHDALDAIGTATSQVIGPFVSFNYGADAACPEVRLTVPQPEDLAAWFQALAIAVDRGHPVARREIDRRLGVTPPVEDEEVLEAARMPTLTAPSPPGEQGDNPDPEEPDEDE